MSHRRLTCIIPSKSAHNLNESVSAITAHDPDVRVIVIDDGVDWAACRLKSYVRKVEGIKPFIFARNVNRGIALAGNDDVVVMGDDAILQTPQGLTTMQQMASRYNYGIMSAVMAQGQVGNPNQFRSGQGFIRSEPRTLCFVCVVIMRDVLKVIPELDARYTGYGLDDDDYCFTARRAGFHLGVFEGCYVDHGSLPSEFRKPGGAGGNFHPNMQKFIAKWGVDNWGNPRESSPFAALFPAKS